MKRPSDKLLKEMTSEELSHEAAWHEREAAQLFDEVRDLREHALELDEEAAFEMLEAAGAKETEAQAHILQSNILNSLKAARLSSTGVGEAHRTVQA